ncbi:Innexin inx2 [Cichlidogyrus casuarinus]|uniref:Innexin n=1 Tax=Cichlidogyrus casuarinus TaxID=1844966 RepID=A0ABD2QG16_9PLAT
MDIAKTVALSFSRFGLDASSENLYYSLEDSADRWNFSYTFVLLCLMCTVSTANVYFLRSFECTTLQNPPEGSNVKEYIQATCWTQGTIALTGNESTPSSPEEWLESSSLGKIAFYQWVPFVLGLQAILFLIPHLIWDFMATHTFGEDTNILLERAISASKAKDLDERHKTVDMVASQITRICVHHADHRQNRWANAQRWMQRKIPGGRLFTVGKRLGNRIVAYYMITKMLYLTNLVGQLFMIKSFLTHGRYGTQLTQNHGLINFSYNLLLSMTDLSSWEGGGSLLFPRRSYCVVSMRGFGNKDNTYLASCALPVNMYNEKLYVFLWLWLTFVLCITVLSIISWLIRLFFFKSSKMFLRTLLQTAHHAVCGTALMQYPCTSFALKSFINDGIRPDGVLMIRMIKANAGSIIASEICLNAWDQFHQFKERFGVIATESEMDSTNYDSSVAHNLQYPTIFPPGFADADPVKATAPAVHDSNSNKGLINDKDNLV